MKMWLCTPLGTLVCLRVGQLNEIVYTLEISQHHIREYAKCDWIWQNTRYGIFQKKSRYLQVNCMTSELMAHQVWKRLPAYLSSYESFFCVCAGIIEIEKSHSKCVAMHIMSNLCILFTYAHTLCMTCKNQLTLMRTYQRPGYWRQTSFEECSGVRKAG